jgi:hypothetical protein
MLTDVKTSIGSDDDGGVVAELAAVAEAKRLGVTRQTIHRKFRKVG